MAAAELQVQLGAPPAESGAPAAGSDQENADPTGDGALRKLWQQGTETIATHRWGAWQGAPTDARWQVPCIRAAADTRYSAGI